jgi:protein phosphatase
MIPVRVGSATDAGKVRRINEDSVFTGRELFAVADGMGGHAAGELASAIAVAHLATLEGRQQLHPNDVRAGLAECNREILAAAEADKHRAGMGTTVAGVAITRLAGADHWLVFNVGDSRVYRYVDDTLAQVSVDHSEVADLVATGAIGADEARSHPMRNVVTRVLGMWPDPVADVWVFPPTPGERFVICSDGLSGELPDEEIQAVLRTEPSAQPAADSLVSQAVAAGGRDNITVVVIDHLVVSQDDFAADTLNRGTAA